MEKAKHARPVRITKLVVEEVSLVDKPANGDEFVLMKRDAEGRLVKVEHAVSMNSVPEIAAYVPQPAAAGESIRLPYDSGGVLALLGRIGQIGEKS